MSDLAWLVLGTGMLMLPLALLFLFGLFVAVSEGEVPSFFAFVGVMLLLFLWVAAAVWMVEQGVEGLQECEMTTQSISPNSADH